MSAQIDPTTGAIDVNLHARYRLRPMREADLDAVATIEHASYPYPWTRGNFADSLGAQYTARVLVDHDDHVHGYLIAMPGVEEMHLLNVCVAPDRQGLGLSLVLLDALVREAQAEGAQLLWLEVRPSNAQALRVYERYGFYPVARRRDYYPAHDAQGRPVREDALVMSAPVGDLMTRRKLAPLAP